MPRHLFSCACLHKSLVMFEPDCEVVPVDAILMMCFGVRALLSDPL
jgi:hypothetical protein